MINVDAWLQDKYVKVWFSQIGNERTRRNYTREFPRFLEFVKASPTEIIQSRLNHISNANRNPLELQFWERELIKYMHSLEKLNLRRSTIHGYLRTVQSFFSHNGVKLQCSMGQLQAEPTQEEKTSRKWVLSNEEIRVVYRHCKTPRDRALLLVAYQCGFLPADIENMMIENFRFYDKNGNWNLSNENHYYHYQMREKTDYYQCTMISSEAVGDIKMMLELRGFPKEGSLFIGFTKTKKGLKAREINEVFKRIVVRPYPDKVKEWKTKNLRDSYSSCLLAGGIQQELKDLMMGHKRKGAKNSYGTPESLKPAITEAYNKCFRFLKINGFGSTSHKLEELEKQVNAKLGQLTLRNLQLTDKLEQQQTQITTLNTKLQRNTERYWKLAETDYKQKKPKTKKQ